MPPKTGRFVIKRRDEDERPPASTGSRGVRVGFGVKSRPTKDEEEEGSEDEEDPDNHSIKDTWKPRIAPPYKGRFGSGVATERSDSRGGETTSLSMDKKIMDALITAMESISTHIRDNTETMRNCQIDSKKSLESIVTAMGIMESSIADRKVDSDMDKVIKGFDECLEEKVYVITNRDDELKLVDSSGEQQDYNRYKSLSELIGSGEHGDDN